MITLTFCPEKPCTGHNCGTRTEHLKRDWNLGLSLWVEPGLGAEPPTIERLLRRSLESSKPTTSTGVAHQMPDAPFLVHTLRGDDGSMTYEAVYCGAEPVDDLLDRAPLAEVGAE